jgi:hypothetical protein
LTVITHALAPVLVATVFDAIRVQTGKKKYFSLKQLIAIGIAGALPDILGMHFSLRGRYTSWTHNIWFLLGIYPVYILVAKRYFRENWLLLTNLLWLATAFHLYIDARSGGIVLFNPYGSVVGDYLIRWPYWVKADIVIIILVIIFSLIIFLKQRKIAGDSSYPVTIREDVMQVEKLRMGRFIFSGILAGIVLTIADFYLNGMILRDDWRNAMVSLNRIPLGLEAISSYLLMYLFLGIALVWLYLVISSRYGRGYKSGVITAFVVWMLAWAWGFVANYVASIYPLKIVLVSILWGFFQITLASLAGSMFYDSGFKKS